MNNQRREQVFTAGCMTGIDDRKKSSKASKGSKQ